MSPERVLKYCFFWFFCFFGFFQVLEFGVTQERVLEYCFFGSFVFFVFPSLGIWGGSRKSSEILFSFGFLQVFLLPEGLSQDLQNIIFLISLLVFRRVFEDCYFFFVLSVLSMAFSQDPKCVFYLLHTRVWCLARKNITTFPLPFY